MTKHRAIPADLALLLYALGVLPATPICAQVTTIRTDASWSRTAAALSPSASNTTVVGNRGARYAIPGNVYNIPETRGKLAGQNLFHSFETFSVGAGDAAVFTTTTPTLANVISRVTGNAPSSVNGLLALLPDHGGRPNLFFINPAGVTFGAGAQVDVPAALHVSTASQLRFADGTLFKAGDGSDSTLTIAAPEAFGFVGGNSKIKLVGVSADGAASRSMVTSNLDVTAGGIDVIDSSVDAEDAKFRLLAVGAGPATLPVDGMPRDVATGTVNIVNSRLSSVGPSTSSTLLAGSVQASSVAVSAIVDDRAPMIEMLGPRVDMDGALIETISFGGSRGEALNPGGIVMEAGRITIHASNVNVLSAWQGDGKGGDINIRATNLDLFDSNVLNQVAGESLGGSVKIAIGEDLLARATVVSSAIGFIATDTFGPGRSGDVVVTAGNLLLDRTEISANASAGSTGNSGNVHVAVADTIALQHLGRIMSLTDSADSRGGNIEVIGTKILIDTQGRIRTQASAGSSGQPGNLTVTALQNITLSNQGDVAMTNSAISPDQRFLSPTTLTIISPEIVIVSDGRIQTRALGNVAASRILLMPSASGKGQLSIRSDGLASGGILAITTGAVDAADVEVRASSLVATDLVVGSATLSSGNASSVRMLVSGDVSITGGVVAAQTFDEGASGNIEISARNLSLNTTSLNTSTSSAGQAGTVSVITEGDVTLHNALISAATEAEGHSGSVNVQARNVELVNATLLSSTLGTGKAGSVSVTASGQITLRDGAIITSRTEGPGHAGNVTVTAENLVADFGVIDSNTSGFFSGGASGNAGLVRIEVQNALTLSNNSLVGSSSLFSAGRGGTVDVSAARVLIDGSAISAEALADSSGQVGTLAVLARDGITLSNGGVLTIQNDAVPDKPESNQLGTLTLIAGEVVLTSGGRISAATSGNLPASNILIRSLEGRERLVVAGDGSGQVTSSVQTARLELPGASPRSPKSIGAGDAGNVQFEAGNVTLSNVAVISEADPGTTGKAGTVSFRVSGDLSVQDGARIGTDTFGAGKAGDVEISARNLLVSRSEISSNAKHGGLGNAGNVRADLRGSLTVRDGGVVSSSTESTLGRAGEIDIRADTILVDGNASAIQAKAAAGSSGQTGNLTLAARSAITLSAGGTLSIRSDGHAERPDSLTPNLLSVSAPSIILKHAQITAESTDDVDASNIRINFTDQLFMDPSGITTSANLGNGGDIDIRGSGLMWLDHSRITTSGGLGNGGDISIAAGTLVMETGFIQANTGGAGATGGNVRIAVQALVPSGNNVSVADPTPAVFQPNAFGFNVIQAAAPSGVSGAIGISGLVLDITAELSGLEAEVIQSGPLGRDLCRAGIGSSLTPMGRGGLRPSAVGLIRPEAPSPSGPIQAAAATPLGGSVRLVQAPSLDCRY